MRNHHRHSSHIKASIFMIDAFFCQLLSNNSEESKSKASLTTHAGQIESYYHQGL